MLIAFVASIISRTLLAPRDLYSHKRSSIINAMTHCLNSRDYEPCNRLLRPVAFQSLARSLARASVSREILRFPICARPLLPTLINCLDVSRRSHTDQPIMIEDSGRRSRVRPNTSLSRPRPLFLSFLSLSLSAFNIRDTL